MKHALVEWAVPLGTTAQTLISRLNKGEDPATAVTRPIGPRGGSNKGAKFPVEALTGDEPQRLLDACTQGPTGVRNRALIVVGWRAGLRCEEALSLRVADLDRGQGTIRVLLGKGRNGGKSRTAGMDGSAWDIVEKWLDLRASIGLASSEFVFCTLDGRPLNKRQVRATMQRLGKKAGIDKHVYYHGLRHTMACELAREGVSMPDIQQQLGHSSLATTGVYLKGLMPIDTVNRMRQRSWSGRLPGVSGSEPGWLDRLRGDLGPRLKQCVDLRTDPERFEAVLVICPSG